MGEDRLYESIGGAPALDVAVTIFYDRVLADPAVAPWFDGGDRVLARGESTPGHGTSSAPSPVDGGRRGSVLPGEWRAFCGAGPAVLLGPYRTWNMAPGSLQAIRWNPPSGSMYMMTNCT